MNEPILKYIAMYRGEMPDGELLDDIICGAYLDEPECQEPFSHFNPSVLDLEKK